MVQDIADDDWLARPSHAPVFEAMVAHGLVFDALVLPRHLPRLARVLERHPALAVVVDHGAKPRIRDREIDRWRASMTVIAAHPRAHCKLSGLVTEAPHDAGPEVLLPYIDTLLGLFGPERLLWGSDWPVVELAGGYDRWRALSLAALAGLSAVERAAVLGGTAERLYLHRE
jgi:L-fuconolactonase